jgi:DNA-binding LytR/AlgR family response regulator
VLRVLIVDDESLARARMRTLLSDCHCGLGQSLESSAQLI